MAYIKSRKVMVYGAHAFLVDDDGVVSPEEPTELARQLLVHLESELKDKGGLIDRMQEVMDLLEVARRLGIDARDRCSEQAKKGLDWIFEKSWAEAETIKVCPSCGRREP